MGFMFRYNEYEKPSSKSYMAPIIKELEIMNYYMETINNDDKVFKVWVEGDKSDISEAAEEQLTLFLMDRYNLRNRSSVTLVIYNNNENKKDNKLKYT